MISLFSTVCLLPRPRYPDVIESCPPPGSGQKHSHTIKSHHNVGGLPKDLQFTLIEPFRELFKDEVRKIGILLGVPETFIKRHPFPGPGLAVRVLGDVTEPGKLETLREVRGQGMKFNTVPPIQLFVHQAVWMQWIGFQTSKSHHHYAVHK